MNNLEIILKLLYKRMPSQAVVEHKIVFNEIEKQLFLQVAASYMKNYSENEAENIWAYHIDMFQKRARQEGRSASDKLNVFDALFYYADDCLVMQNNEVRCQYHKLLDWRQVTIEVSEDLVVAAYFAQKKISESMNRRGFSWKRIIGHNNTQLNQMLLRGISENHFHLNGSAPIFQISWLSLMNNVISSKMAEHLNTYYSNRRYTNIAYSGDYEEKSFFFRYLQAALIRVFLYAGLTGKKLCIGSYFFPAEYLISMMQLPEFMENGEEKVIRLDEQWIENAFREKDQYTFWEIFAFFYTGGNTENFSEEALKTVGENKKYLQILDSDLKYVKCSAERIRGIIRHFREKVSMSELFKTFIICMGEIDLSKLPADLFDCAAYDEIWQERTLENVNELLKYPENIQAYQKELQSIIDSFRFPFGHTEGHSDFSIDYLLWESKQSGSAQSDPYYLFVGERWLLYEMLRRIWMRNSHWEKYFNLFYAYVLIKESIRSELVQSNDNVGFRNFHIYQNRKLELLQDEIYREALTRAAMQESLLRDNIRTIEIRISPVNDEYQLKKMLKKLDGMFDPKEKYRHRFFYTLNFTKSKDSVEPKKNMLGICCRHERQRNQYEQKAMAINNLRRHDPVIGKRILGIDAASNEIGCRPEVFGSVFRFLRNQTGFYEETPEGKFELQQLRVTYHVGEDFLDLADGLRAIDEAVHFLNLDCGDRMGHALALGVDPKEWYQTKNNTIALTKQDYLDNIVWIYHKLCKYQIDGFENLKDDIQKEFTKYFDEIYRMYMDAGEMKAVGRKYEHLANQLKWNFNIYNYYSSWKLRGDDPSLYQMGYFNVEEYLDSGKKSRINHQTDSELRIIPSAALLYYHYHYNANVRRKGEEKIQVQVSGHYIDAVCAIQKSMQRDIACRGIGIETNPSSNYQIGTFKSYDKHPIIYFYNKDLTFDMKKQAECAQINVSINTDDQGVFDTSLENEYALLACALEKVKDEQGLPVYNRTMIYEWLDHIRIMGNEQSFGFTQYMDAVEKEGRNE